jgi:hypothetical protein
MEQNETCQLPSDRPMIACASSLSQAIGNWTCAICRDPSMRAFRPYYVTGENKRHVFAYGLPPLLT